MQSRILWQLLLYGTSALTEKYEAKVAEIMTAHVLC